jgi:tetratricopeptide (TPR) repeat protein
LIPVAELFDREHYSKFRQSKDKLLLLQESWLIVHYILQKQMFREFVRYADQTELQHTPIPQAIETSFNMSPVKFDAALLAHAKFDAGQIIRIQVGQGFDAKTFSSSVLDGDSVAAILANFRIHANLGKDKAVESLHSILNRNPSSLFANLAAGSFFLTDKRYPEAEVCLKKAIELDKKNEAAQLLYGNLQLDLAVKAKEENQGQQKEEHLLLAWDHLKTATRLAPHLAAAHYSLSVGYAELKDWQSAIAEAKAAATLNRENQFYLLNLGNILFDHREFATAKAIYQQLVETGSSGAASIAQQKLDEITQMEGTNPVSPQ